MNARRVLARIRRRSSDAQPRDDAAVPQVLVDDLLDVGTVDVRVPDRLRIDHRTGAFLAAVEAARLVDAHPAGAVQTELLYPLLGVVAHGGGALAVAAGPLAAVPLVAAEKDMPFVVPHGRRFYRRGRVYRSGLRRSAAAR